MFTKLFALIDSIKALKQLAQLLYREYTKHLIQSAQGDIDDHYDERSVWLDAIKQAQREKDEEKVMRYSYALSTGRLPEPGVQEADSQRLSSL